MATAARMASKGRAAAASGSGDDESDEHVCSNSEDILAPTEAELVMSTLLNVVKSPSAGVVPLDLGESARSAAAASKPLMTMGFFAKFHPSGSHVHLADDVASSREAIAPAEHSAAISRGVRSSSLSRPSSQIECIIASSVMIPAIPSLTRPTPPSVFPAACQASALSAAASALNPITATVSALSFADLLACDALFARAVDITE